MLECLNARMGKKKPDGEMLEWGRKTAAPSLMLFSPHYSSILAFQHLGYGQLSAPV